MTSDLLDPTWCRRAVSGSGRVEGSWPTCSLGNDSRPRAGDDTEEEGLRRTAAHPETGAAVYRPDLVSLTPKVRPRTFASVEWTFCSSVPGLPVFCPFYY